MEKEVCRPSYKPHVILGIVLVTLAAGILWLYFGQGKEDTPYESTHQLMGTYVQQTVYGENGEQAAAAAAERISELEDLISWRVEGSDVYSINRLAGTDFTQVSEKTFALLKCCLEVSLESGGAYDPTVYPITALWDIDGDCPRVPSEKEIKKFLRFVDRNALHLKAEEHSASLSFKGMALDLGGAGKGAACDEAIAAYREAEVSAAVIAVGGSIGVYGTKRDGSPWKIAIRNPFSEEGGPSSIATLRMESGFVSTSGVYEKRFTQNGKTYHHILDPKTGYPAESGLVSATVWHENGAVTDLLSTACIVLGAEKSLPLLSHYGAKAVFVTEDGAVLCTEGIGSQLTLNDEDAAPEVLTFHE